VIPPNSSSIKSKNSSEECVLHARISFTVLL
jgi:hypothetical protein